MIHYSHTNLIAKDVARMISFYRDVLGCQSIGETRDLSGEWVDRLTGIPGAHIFGEHLALPGYPAGGPTLEIFQYHPSKEGLKRINRAGFAHIAFAVEDVAAAREAVFAAGGSEYGQMTHVEINGAGTITFAYMADPEGNILELQHWQLTRPS